METCFESVYDSLWRPIGRGFVIAVYTKTFTPSNPHLVQQTLSKFVRNLPQFDTNTSWLELAFLCWGINTPITNFPERSILRSEIGFQTLQKLISNAEQRGTFSAYLWQGLWLAFLNFNDRQSLVALKNWKILRQNLHDSFKPLLATMQFLPYWLEAIERHPIIFHADVTRQLAKQALDNNNYREITLLEQDIEIPSTSWFWVDLLTAQVQEVIGYDDARFKNTFDRLLEQLPKHPEYLDEGLAQLLDRYAECADKTVHLGLKRLAVKQWKSPSLSQQNDWMRVEHETKAMVQQWLAQEDIYDIFHKLAQDHRRYEFWMQFLDQIKQTFVWLGRDASYQHGHLLKDKSGRCALLKGAATPENNAILMKIGGYYIIEFGAKAGGKCWAYPESVVMNWMRVSSLDYRYVLNKRECLWSNSDGLPHLGDNWEEDKFIPELRLLGIKPTVMSFEELLERYQLKVEKQPSGTEIIKHNRGVGTLAKELNKHRFYYSPSQNLFYRNR